jgi:hypothetical protein
MEALPPVLFPQCIVSQGAVAPLVASPGWYTTPGTSAAASLQQDQVQCPTGSYCTQGARYPCPPGQFGSTPGLESLVCTGACDVGHYCPSGSTAPNQVPCGSARVYCPPGSGAPVAAQPGEETVGGGGPLTRGASAPCPSGSYCVNGTAMPCPAGRYGCSQRLSVPDCNGVCSAGEWHGPVLRTRWHLGC